MTISSLVLEPLASKSPKFLHRKPTIFSYSKRRIQKVAEYILKVLRKCHRLKVYLGYLKIMNIIRMFLSRKVQHGYKSGM